MDKRLRELERVVRGGGQEAVDAAVSLAAAYGRMGEIKLYALIGHEDFNDNPTTLSLHYSYTGAMLGLKKIILRDLEERKALTGPGLRFWRERPEDIQYMIDRILSGEYPLKVNKNWSYPDAYGRYTSYHTHISYSIREVKVEP